MCCMWLVVTGCKTGYADACFEKPRSKIEGGVQLLHMETAMDRLELGLQALTKLTRVLAMPAPALHLPMLQYPNRIEWTGRIE